VLQLIAFFKLEGLHYSKNTVKVVRVPASYALESCSVISFGVGWFSTTERSTQPYGSEEL